MVPAGLADLLNMADLLALEGLIDGQHQMQDTVGVLLGDILGVDGWNLVPS